MNSLARALAAVFALATVASCEPPPLHGDGETSLESSQQALSSDTLVTERPIIAGLYAPSTADRPIALERTYDQFVSDYGSYWNRNYRLVAISSHVRNGTIYYNGVWTPSSAAQYYHIFRTYDQFAADYGLRISQGYRLVSVSNVVLNGVAYWTGVFNPGTAGQVLGLARTVSQFSADYNYWHGQGYRLVTMASTVLNGQPQYTGVWAPSSAAQVFGIQRPFHTFLADNDYWVARGYRLASISSYVLNDVAYYNGLWNPSSANVVLNIGAPRPDFEAQHRSMATSNMRLIALHTALVEGLAINRLASSVSNTLRNNSVGSAVTVKAQGHSQSSAAATGEWRTTTNSPQTFATVGTRLNSASVTKLLTAAAVMKLLNTRRLTQNSLVQSYLPSDWARGPNVGSLTFAQLLSHRSGLKGSNTGDWLDYTSLRNMIAGGRPTPPSGGFPVEYRNFNFAIFRFIIPYLNGFSESGVTNKDLATTNAYLKYMNEQIFVPSGIAGTVRGSSPNNTLYYPFPHSGTSGFVWGDLTPQTGGGFLYLSSWEYADFLKALREDRLFPSSWRGLMETSGYGFDVWNRAVRHGVVSFKGGFIPQTLPNGRQAEVNTGAYSFSTGAVVGVTINSAVTVNVFQTVVDAYNNSWIPVR